MSEWNTMDSAPRDGTTFQLLCEHGAGNFFKVTAKWRGDGWQDVAEDSCVGVLIDGRNYATAKWKPNPSRPA